MKKTIVGLVGFIGSGKGTVSSYLKDTYNFQNLSFAKTLKDAVANIFHWPRNLLEGDTSESRQWREEIDIWWANRLDIPHLTPRWVLQNLGTNVIRKEFHDDMWIASLERSLLDLEGNYVISDLRFPNEIKMLKNQNSKIWWIQRGDLPVWYNTAYYDKNQMSLKFPTVHESEYAWINQARYTVIINNGTLEDLHAQVDTCLKL